MRALSASASSFRRSPATGSRHPLAATAGTASGRHALGGQRLRMSTAEAPPAETSVAEGGSGAAAKGAAQVEELPTNDSSPELLKIRHTTSHVMAQAVQKLFPGTQVTIGPWIDNG